jgi:hypothetical protein
MTGTGEQPVPATLLDQQMYLKSCLNQHLHDPRIQEILLAVCHDEGYAQFLRCLPICPNFYLSNSYLSRHVTLVTCKSTHPSYLALPFQLTRPDGLFETTIQFDRNRTPHPPLVKGYSGTSKDVESLFGHLSGEQEANQFGLLNASDSFIFFVVYPTNVWRVYRYSLSRSESIHDEIF